MPYLTPIRIAFLLGSGVSIPAGMPSTRDITEQVLSGEGVKHHSDSNYYFDDSLCDDGYVPRVVIFLHRLKVEIALYYLYQTWRSINYEDFYYVASQIEDSELGARDNPVVKPFIDKILPEIGPLLIGREQEIREEWKLHKLAAEATHYIRDVAWGFLLKEPNRLDHLDSLVGACQDDQLPGVDIFTLNHDTVLEQYLSQKGIQVTDGFEDPQNKVRYWNPNLFESGPSKVRLFKLHGSVNWFRLRSNDGDWRDARIGIVEDWQDLLAKIAQGQMKLPLKLRPEFLAGTFNKVLQYSDDIYADLQYQFYRSLRSIQRLVICGYGFADKAINTRIINWFFSPSQDRRIVIVHPDPDRLKRAARGEASNIWLYPKNPNMVTFLANGIEGTSWREISHSLFCE